MPRYYFDVREGEKLTRDEEGEELPDVPAARTEATLSAISIGSELLTADNLSISVQVRNERGQQVVKASVSLSVEELPSSSS